MNLSILPGTVSSAGVGVPQQRSDEDSRAIVDRGIMVQNSFNTICAVEYLKSHNVDPEVIERVLLHPEMRRKLRH